MRDGDAARMPLPYAGKVPRDRLTSLTIDTAICPQVTLRVLGLLAQRSLIPLAIAAERRSRSMRLVIELDTLTGAEAELLLAKIEAIVMVRRAKVRRRKQRRG